MSDFPSVRLLPAAFLRKVRMAVQGVPLRRLRCGGDEFLGAAIEAETEIQLGKNQYAYRTATLEAEGTVPAVLNEILKKAEEM